MWYAVAVIGAAAVGAVAASSAASKAAKAQEHATDSAQATQWAMYQQTREDQLPWLTAGSDALTKLQTIVDNGPGDFAKSDYYQQGLAEENKATNAFLASRGQYASGGAAKDLQANAVNNMNKNRTNWLNEWIQTQLNPTQSLAQVGQSTATNLGNVGTNVASNVANNQVAAGNARATGYINQANATTGAINSGANALALYYGNQSQQTPPAGTTPNYTTNVQPYKFTM